MEIVKSRIRPELLTALNVLDKRMALPVKEKPHIINMEKGYKGEELFDSLIKEYVRADVLFLNDLLLTISEQTVQIDSLILTADTVFLYEIKNYKDDYQMKSGQLLTLTGQEIGDPLTQLKRTTSLLRQLFQQWSINIIVEAAVVYVNSTFTLYHACPEDRIILPNQIPGHFTKINRQRLTLTKKRRYLAERLLSEHKLVVPYQKQLPDYDYQILKKGITCSNCGSFDIQFTQRTCYCEDCNNRNSKKETIVSNVEEFRLLFPSLKITRNIIHDWCGEGVSKDRVSRILFKHYHKTGQTLGTFYE
ncbi:nuclease-related domain-containing protein [Alkalibacterium sp. 20]|uniref:nuclease-related domain-containing protein n=1 Tax=Alkalibacterium sp. 20 TaxID=1798803 RepID=UPI0008FFEB81|nr:nuclease-related domain-containing protein [Alkalibacterium sp. 20]OJF92904.1 hypothetical protein AX762_09350 [Alkalibacterium sp. 20]